MSRARRAPLTICGLALTAILALLLMACGSGEATEDTGSTESTTQTATDEHAGHDHGDGGHDTAQATTTPGTTPPLPPAKLAASHILIMHVGSQRAPAEVTRTKEEAKTLADEVYAKVTDGLKFEDAAGEFSDGPSGPRGGSLGVFPYGQMIPAFSAATAKLAVGEVSKPVETQFGYHIIRRDEIVEAGIRHILFMHEGSERKPADITRTKDEAKAEAEKVLAEIRGGADFQEMAKLHSDGPSGPRGGDLGVFGRGKMVPAFDAVAFDLKVDQVSDLVETQFGFHILQRYQ